MFEIATKEISRQSTAKFQLAGTRVNDCPVTLICAPATEANPPYFNALLKEAGTKRGRAATVKDVAGLKDLQEKQRKLYAEHVVQGWEGIKDSTGVDVPFDRALCHTLFESMTSYDLSDLILFCSEPLNFVGEGIDAGNLPDTSSGS